MNKQNLRPQATQPVQRTPTGQLPPKLAELAEEPLSQLGSADASFWGVQPSYVGGCAGNLDGSICSYDGDDAE